MDKCAEKDSSNTRRGAFGTAVILAAMGLAANAASVAIDSVQQRWPWNNKVDITYTVTGDDLASKVGKVRIIAVVNGLTYVAYDDPIGAAKVGTFTVTWNDPPPGVKSEDCKMFATIQTSRPVRSGDDYMIIDLATGAVTYEGLFTSEDVLDGVSGQELSNARYNQDKYKDTHLALRKVPKGTYKTGDGGTTTWTTTKDYYIAVFPVTHRQYLRFVNMDPDEKNIPLNSSNLRSRPLNYIIDVRGTADPSAAPQMMPGKFPIIAWLNEKTGMAFDIPTRYMHEIATRAGTTTKYYWGADSASQADCSRYAVCEYSSHSVNNMLPVGSRLPNNWGLYDMVGNDWQLCIDAKDGTYPEGNDDIFVPATLASGTPAGYVVRGNDTAGRTNVGSATESIYGSGAIRVAYIVPNSGD